MSPIIDRAEEQRELRNLLTAKQPQLALLYGRRRVGKTYLLNHIWPRGKVFYFTAAETTEEQNRAALVNELALWLNEDLRIADYPTWRTIFRLLLETRAPEPLVVVLDEFQYFGDGLADVRRVASDLNAVWEQARPARPFVLVLSGSIVKTMEALADGGALYGRFNWIGKIEPFDYWHTAKMLPFDDFRDRVRTYAAFGGTPRYLSAVNVGDTVNANIARLLLHPRGEVRTLIETALVQERGLTDVAKYQAILRAIGTGTTTFSQIKSKAGLQESADTVVRRMVEKLIDLGYVRRERNIGAEGTAPYLYRIGDPAFAFYYDFVTRYEAALARNDPEQLWTEHIEPLFNAYIGHAFERIVEQAYRRMSGPKSMPMTLEWGRWEGQDRDRRSLEIDIVAPLPDKRVLTGGIKWSVDPISVKWHYYHMEMLQRLTSSGVKWAHVATRSDSPVLWVAASGFAPGFKEAVQAERSEAYFWDLADLYL